ncbi:ABC transporter substrate-binding protein [Paracraurococcus lichenis]|uniref:ABC transporter substrate-binding protein n=1 Tax=Paracraurococcus lichenis TaxID=3064888 RepID=A0ABT9E3S3_9PROT|nr:ABC transporter substrate-binding protein [Paracraurococcus sp. LOR1-02]MDO9710797.1 ABC transporter substrate-binding protein [Paracraurococcus sp. LOR1-02]
MTMPTRRTLLLLAALAPLPALAQGSPAAVIEGFNATLLAVMKDAQRLGLRGRAQRLRPAMEQAFNLPAMTRISVGPAWTQIPPAGQQSLVQAFSDWSIATFAHRFDGFSGESFRIEGENTLQSGDRLVRTQLVRPADQPVALNYLMRESGGAWRVVDVYLEGTVSELASRRAEFTTLLREGGAPRLEAELRRRTETLLGG